MKTGGEYKEVLIDKEVVLIVFLCGQGDKGTEKERFP